ncbi:MAG TPA: DUF6062 family protein [Spirochaetia bacterium]|nr:DUF6062 family protein [Spirochaetia bacterium]
MPKLEISKVHDAYAQNEPCPLCTLMESAERIVLLSFQHSRVMEPNVRVKTNAAGFCPDHLGKLYRGENKLGLALVMLTHLQQQKPGFSAALDRSLEAAHDRTRSEQVREVIASLVAARDSCFICDLLAEDLARYAWTIVYLWEKDEQFPGLFRGSRGFCLSHFCTVLESASEALRGNRFAELLTDLVPVMKRTLDSLDVDLTSFTQLHQAANQDLGTDEVRSALSRTLQMLSGRVQRQT